MRILRDGRLRFSPWICPGLPQLDFMALHDADRVDANYSVHANWRGRPIFIVYVTRHRVESTCFAYQLTPDELREAVDIMRKAGGGIERWITAGLEWNQRSMARSKPEPNRDAVLAILPELLESVRALPVAEAWKKQRREWERESSTAKVAANSTPPRVRHTNRKLVEPEDSPGSRSLLTARHGAKGLGME